MPSEQGFITRGQVQGQGYLETQDGNRLAEGRFVLIRRPAQRHAPLLSFQVAATPIAHWTTQDPDLWGKRARIRGTTDAGDTFLATPLVMRECIRSYSSISDEWDLSFELLAIEITIGTPQPCDTLLAFLSNAPMPLAHHRSDSTIVLDTTTGTTLTLRRCRGYNRLQERLRMYGGIAYTGTVILRPARGQMLESEQGASMLDCVKWILRFGTAQTVILPEMIALRKGRPIWQRLRPFPATPWARSDPIMTDFLHIYPDSGLLPLISAAYPVLSALDSRERLAVQTAIDMYVHSLSGVVYPIPVYDIAYAYESLRERFLTKDEQSYIQGIGNRDRLKSTVAEVLRDQVFTDGFYASHTAGLNPAERDALQSELGKNISDKASGFFDRPFRENVRHLLRKNGVQVPVTSEARDWIDNFVALRNKCIHGSWKPASGPGETSGIQPHLNRATVLLEIFILKRLGYRGWFWDRSTNQDKSIS